MSARQRGSSNKPVWSDCKSRKATNNAFHLSRPPNSINAKGEVLNGLSSFWARYVGGKHKRNFRIYRRNKTSGSHCSLLL